MSQKRPQASHELANSLESWLKERKKGEAGRRKEKILACQRVTIFLLFFFFFVFLCLFSRGPPSVSVCLLYGRAALLGNQ